MSVFFYYLCKLKKTEIMAEVIEFEIRKEEEFIELIKLLKATNVAESGAMAQILVTEGEVKRNGQTELRKRAKILRGEEIETLGKKIKVK